MSSDRAPLCELVWREIFPWVRLTRTAAIAWSWKALVLSLLGMTLTAAGWRGIAWASARYSRDDATLQEQAKAYESAAELPTPFADVSFAKPLDPSTIISAPAAAGRALVDLPVWYTRPFWQLFVADGWPALSRAALDSLWMLAVWAFCGGAITRLAAARLAQDRSLGLFRTGRYAVGRWRSYFSGPLLPLGGVALFVLVPALIAGAVARLDVGFAIVGALWPLGLLLALMTSVMLVALLVGWPLMAAAVSVDGSDAYDSVGRMFGFVTHRPFHLAFYAAVAAVIGVAAWCYVAILGELSIRMIGWAVSWGSGAARAAEIDVASSLTSAGAAAEATGGRLIAFWAGLVRIIVAAFGHSFLWTAATGIYLLLRRNTDGAPLEAIFQDGGEALAGGPRRSPLEIDAAQRAQAASRAAP